MASNKGFKMQIKANDGYNVLHPTITVEQVLGWDIAGLETAEIVLPSGEWKNYGTGKMILTIKLGKVTGRDKVRCSPIYEGTKESMVNQVIGYSMIESIETRNGSVIFIATEKPTTDIKVQLWWTK